MAYGSSQARGWLEAIVAGLTNTPRPQQRWIRAASETYTTVHGNARFLTHWVRPGIKPASSWTLVTFVTTEPQQEPLNVRFNKWAKFFLRSDECGNNICSSALFSCDWSLPPVVTRICGIFFSVHLFTQFVFCLPSPSRRLGAGTHVLSLGRANPSSSLSSKPCGHRVSSPRALGFVDRKWVKDVLGLDGQGTFQK